jgi:hypothetical protein
VPLAPFVANSVTSLEAAEAIAPKAGSLRARVLEAIRFAGERGATDEELQTVLAMNPSTQRPRRIELAHAGLIREASFTRKTRSGRAATVWMVA